MEGKKRIEGRRRARARSAEIVYFSLAKRRKIKGKQETTARDGGNQAGLRPGMDFPGANAGHRAAGWLIVVQERGIPPPADPIETSQWPARSHGYSHDFRSDFCRISPGRMPELQAPAALFLSSGFGISLQEFLNFN